MRAGGIFILWGQKTDVEAIEMQSLEGPYHMSYVKNPDGLCLLLLRAELKSLLLKAIGQQIGRLAVKPFFSSDRFEK
jgi:hypothetical protein